MSWVGFDGVVINEALTFVTFFSEFSDEDVERNWSKGWRFSGF